MLVSLDVVDTTLGRAAEGVPVTLHRDGEANGLTIPSQLTDAMGRATWPEPSAPRGKYRLEVELDRYFGSMGVTPFQSCVHVDFRIFDADETVNLLVMISPTSNTTCRMSAEPVKS